MPEKIIWPIHHFLQPTQVLNNMSNAKKSDQYLVVSILGSDKVGIANELSKLAAHCGCNLTGGRFNTYGQEFTANLMLTGTWNAIAKFESALTAFEKKHDMRIICKRTQPKQVPLESLPYMIYIIAIDKPDVVHKVTHFFVEQGLSIAEFYISNYKTPYSETPMLNISLGIIIPENKSLLDFRENLMLFCDDHNFDVILEPQKS